jgi:hypothetical protein
MQNEDVERILKFVADSLEGGKDFVLEQAPTVVQQLILLGRVECVCGIVLATLVCAACAWVFRRYAPLTSERTAAGLDASVACGASGGVGTAALIVGVVVFFKGLPAFIAPHVYVISEAARLVR